MILSVLHFWALLLITSLNLGNLYLALKMLVFFCLQSIQLGFQYCEGKDTKNKCLQTPLERVLFSEMQFPVREGNMIIHT